MSQVKEEKVNFAACVIESLTDLEKMMGFPLNNKVKQLHITQIVEKFNKNYDQLSLLHLTSDSYFISKAKGEKYNEQLLQLLVFPSINKGICCRPRHRRRQ